MLRTKKDVEKHVTCALSKIDNENERKLRGYTCARLYYQVKDYETAKKYLSSFLSVREHHAPARKLLAEIHEATGNIENALQCYKCSLEIDSQQKEIILKICELYCKLPVDHETARYWADRAEQIFPHHNTVFRLRECLVSAEGEPDRQDLENLIATELTAQPRNVDLRIKLLRLYLDTERVKEAYDHVTKIESKKLFTSSIDWYYLLSDVFEAYQEEFPNDLDAQFYINFLSSLDHLVSLTLAEPHSLTYENGMKVSSINDAAAVLFLFDQQLKKACGKDVRDGSWKYFLQHMKGQLYFHMATLLMKRAKKDQGNWKEACRLSSALFLVGYTFKPSNLLQEIWFSKLEDQKLFTNFFQCGALRTSFTGHVIISLCNEDKSKWLHKIKQDVCLTQVRERIYNRLFGSITQKDKLLSSYFAQDSTFIECSLEFPSLQALQEYNNSTYKLCCDSLHHLVWLQLHLESSDPTAVIESNLSEVFKGLQYSHKDLLKGSAESLCVLDLEAYLQATTYQAKCIVEQKLSRHSERNQHSPMCFPPDITDALCSKQQSNWWYAAYGLFSSSISEKLGEHRRNLQHGLEVIRGIGTHGMETQLVVHLAHSFADRAARLKDNDQGENQKSSPELQALETRATHYWNIALGMLEKLSSGQTLRVPKDKMFAGSEQKLSKDEINSLLEEGKLYLAVILMNSEKLDEAAEILSKLLSAYASYYLSLILKKTAFKEEKSSATRTALLEKAKSALHDTLDRIKDDKNHALNKEIYIELEEVECELAKDLSSCNESYAEAFDETDEYDDAVSSPIHNALGRNGTPSSVFPKIINHSTPKPSSSFTLAKSKYQYSCKERSKHVQPSPERLDAQIRALALNQDTLVKTLMQQQQALLETNRAIVDELKKNKDIVQHVTKQLEELQLSSFKFLPKKMTRKTGIMKGQGDDEEEYEYDGNGLLDYYTEDGNDDFRATGYSFDPPRMMHEQAAPPPINYVVSPALPPGPPPQLAHYNYQYPSHPALPQPPPPPAVAERPFYHPTPGQGLPFSEGQQLPQFHFHVASPVMKQPGMSNMAPLPQTMQPPPSVIPQPSGQIPVPNPWLKPVGVPHAFQIPLPTTSIVPVTIQQPTSLITTIPKTTQPSQSDLKSLLVAPPTMGLAFGNVTASSSTVPVVQSPIANPPLFAGLTTSPEVRQLDRSRCDSEVAGSSDAEAHELEKEVMGDFKPLIPLPAEVAVETGEENEVALFEDRAKLYRFADQEWKERGIGIVKILHHESSGRVRLLMRRDQVLKVCANHYLTSKMEIHAMKNSDKAWTWVAQDFADEELKPESFCIRFKTSDIAILFKNAFEKSLQIVREAEQKFIFTPMSQPEKSLSVTTAQDFSKFLPKAGSWTCPSCYVSNTVEKTVCVACETKKPGLPLLSSTTYESEPKGTVVFQHPMGISNQSFSVNKNDQPASIANSTFSIFSKPATVTDSSKNTLGGFTFTTNPTIQETKDSDTDREILIVSTKAKSGPQVTKASTPKSSPFVGFSFKTSPSSTSTVASFSAAQTITNSSTPSQVQPKETETTFGLKSSVISSDFSSLNSNSSFLTGTKESSNASNTASPLVVTLSKDGRRVSSDVASESTPEEFVPTAEFQPVVPLPALVDVKTGEENEEKLFAERAKLFRFDPESKEWKERGLGELKILHQKNSQKYRILMRRDQVLKLCANHHIIPDMKLTFLSTNDKTLSWYAQDYSEGCLKQEQFAARFKTTEIAKQFLDTFTKCQLLLKSQADDNSKNCDKETNVKDPCADNSSRFNQLFKPVSDSWECSKCHKRNSTSQNTCLSCKLAETDKASPNPVPETKPLSELFKPEPGTWECKSCYVRNKSSDSNKCESCGSDKVGNNASTASDNKQSFGDVFKPQPGSWECKSCYVRNKSSDSKCVSCGSDKVGNNAVTNENPVFGSTSSDNKSFGDVFKPQPGSWECQSCYVRNTLFNVQCVSCGSAKVGLNTITNEQFVSKFSSGTKQQSFTDLFKSQFGSWECQSCKFKNTSDTSTCTSCQAAKSTNNTAPNTADTVPKAADSSSKNIFANLKLVSSVETPGPLSFSFGSLKSSQGEFVFGRQQASRPSTFSFGMSAVNVTEEEQCENESDSTSSSSEASSNGQSQRYEPQTSAIPVLTPVPSTGFAFQFPQSSEFSFGSPQKYEFSFSGVKPQSPTKTPKSPKSPAVPSDVDDDEVLPSNADNIYFQPVIPLPPKVETKTGEESEQVLFCSRAKLFRFVNSEWKERGIGDIKILFDESQKKARLLMRRDQVLKVCLNHNITKEITFDFRNEKSLTWAATDFSETDPSPELFAVRFKTKEFATEFKEAIDEANNLIEGKSVPLRETTSPTSPLKNADSFSFKLNSDKSDPAPTSFSLAARFGTSSVQSKSVFGNISPSQSNALTESKPLFGAKVTSPLSAGSFFSKAVAETNGSQTTYSSPTMTFQQKVHDDEIEIVYEATASLEDIKLAEHFLLPPTFFLYKQKEPCKGCIGCKDEIPPYKTASMDTDETTKEGSNIPTSSGAADIQAMFPNATVAAFSFADLAKNPTQQGFTSLTSQSGFGVKSGFAGAGTPLFANLNKSTENDEDEDTVAQCPDIHFEPVIPLPELIDVKTGEEDEVPVFSNRAKLFRYDTSLKQWKERGIGEFKILEHRDKLRYRLILRREQVHKVACNHCITKDMELNPLNTSDTSLCWNAIDYSEGQAEASQFAIRFKNKEILKEFLNKFKECKLKLIQAKETTEESALQVPEEQAATTSTSAPEPGPEPVPSANVSAPDAVSNYPQVVEEEGTDSVEEETDEEDVLIFDKRVSFSVFDDKAKKFQSLGMGRLTIKYDDDVYGYRIAMIGDNDIILCDHIIAIQTSLRVEKKKAVWAAIDLSLDPPVRRQFQAMFSSNDSIAEFNKLFQDGKEIAISSEIVERDVSDRDINRSWY